MAKYRIAWLPGDGIGVEVLEAAEVVLDKLELDAEYPVGDLGQTLKTPMHSPSRNGVKRSTVLRRTIVGVDGLIPSPATACFETVTRSSTNK